MNNKIIITEDKECEMLSIRFNDKSLFYGNYWDFNRDGNAFFELFKKAGLSVSLEEKEYDLW